MRLGYGSIFVVMTLALILVANIPLISTVLPFTGSQDGNPFSELWVLGPDHTIGGYPFNVTFGKEEALFMGVRNHLGHVAYYDVQVKLCNHTQPLPDKGEPSALPSLREFSFILKEDEGWETSVNFTVLDGSFFDSSSSIELLAINNDVFEVNSSSRWDPDHTGFYYHLFFELWLYNVTSQHFEYHERFVSIVLNMTA